NAYVEYQAAFQGSTFKGKADFDISFDKESLKDAKASDKPGYEDSEPKEDPKKEDSEKEDPKKDENGTNKKGTKNEETPKPRKDTPGPDKAFAIEYSVKHASEDEVSAAHTFCENPAYVLYKNGEKYLQLTATTSNMIDSLRTANGDV